MLKLFNNMDSLQSYKSKYENQNVASLPVDDTQTPIYGDQSLIGKKCELIVRCN